MTTTVVIAVLLAAAFAVRVLRKGTAPARDVAAPRRAAGAPLLTSDDWDFVVVDADGKLQPAAIAAFAAAMQRQVREQFAPRWRSGSGTAVRAATATAPPLTGEVQVLLHATAPVDKQDALGFHDRQPDGTPVAHVFLDLCTKYGELWTVVSSHEVLEVLGDAMLLVAFQTVKGFCAAEVADPVQGAPFVTVDGVQLSNFVFPAWFAPDAAGGETAFDQLKVLKASLQVAAGGYSQFFDPSAGWQIVGAATAYRAHVASLGLSRGSRRASCGSAGSRNPSALVASM